MIGRLVASCVVLALAASPALAGKKASHREVEHTATLELDSLQSYGRVLTRGTNLRHQLMGMLSMAKFDLSAVTETDIKFFGRAETSTEMKGRVIDRQAGVSIHDERNHVAYSNEQHHMRRVQMTAGTADHSRTIEMESTGLKAADMDSPHLRVKISTKGNHEKGDEMKLWPIARRIVVSQRDRTGKPTEHRLHWGNFSHRLPESRAVRQAVLNAAHYVPRLLRSPVHK